MRCTPAQKYCPRCGYLLPDVVSVEQRSPAVTGLLPSELGEPVLIQPGTGFFHRQARLFLHHDSGKSIPIDVRSGIKIVGRRAPDATGESNLIDLSELGAKELGVSRRHVQLSLSDESIYAIDLGSTNGTFLNRERLIPEKPYVVRNRAVLQVGVLILRVQFG
jgi:hypothetical protein